MLLAYYPIAKPRYYLCLEIRKNRASGATGGRRSRRMTAASFSPRREHGEFVGSCIAHTGSGGTAWTTRAALRAGAGRPRPSPSCRAGRHASPMPATRSLRGRELALQRPLWDATRLREGLSGRRLNGMQDTCSRTQVFPSRLQVRPAWRTRPYCDVPVRLHWPCRRKRRSNRRILRSIGEVVINHDVRPCLGRWPGKTRADQTRTEGNGSRGCSRYGTAFCRLGVRTAILRRGRKPVRPVPR